MNTLSAAAAGGRDQPVPVLPSPALLLGGAICWGLLMAGCALLALYLQDRWQSFHLTRVLAVYVCGGFLAWPVALPAARFLTRRRRVETRFAAQFALLALGTVAATAFVFAMDYRLFYAQWHQPFATRIWLLQFLFTSAGAVYQFLVMGLTLFLPAGLPVLAGASLWLAKSMR